MRPIPFGSILPLAVAVAQVTSAQGCGEVLGIAGHSGSRTRYAFSAPDKSAAKPVTLALLAGGAGFVDLDERGCARKLKGNSLVRSIALFRAQGFGVALIDAPSDHQDEDGLAGFRTDPSHAEDLGKVIAALRASTQGAVWLVGTSRGTLSAANAAARLTGPAAPDGVVLTSVLSVGQAKARKSWVAQSVFDLPLEAIKQPLLLIGHAADDCARSPATMMGRIAGRARSARQQVVTVTGGPGGGGLSGIEACEGRSPHGFLGQEEEVADGMARFIRGVAY